MGAATRVVGRSLPLLWQASPSHTLILGLLTALQGILPAVAIWISRPLVDAAVAVAAQVPGASVDRVLWLIAGWLLAILLGTAISPLVMAVQGLLTDKLTAHVNLLLMAKSASLPGLEHFERAAFYDQLQLIQEEAAWRPVNLLVFLSGLIRSLIATVAVLLPLAQFHPLIPVIILITATPHAIASFRLQNDAFELLVWRSPEARRMRYYSEVMLTHRYAKEVRMNDLSALFLGLYRSTFEKVFAATMHLRFRQITASTAFVLVGVAGIGTAFWWVLSGAVAGTVTAGGLFLFIQALLMSQQNITLGVEHGSMLYETLLYMQKLTAFLDAPPSLSTEGKIRAPLRMREGIQFQDVHFAYPGAPPTLHGVNFSIRAGEVVAVVGENGAGKTTIVKLLTRLYDPTKGAIRVDGRDLHEYDLASWRRSIATVFQDFAQFQLSARLNIATGSMDQAGNLDAIHQAAALGGADEVIARLPGGFETQLGKQFEGGVELSGGEWQKVALARAFLRDAPLIILDEPTSALDPRSEYEVIRKFTELVRGRTVLLISHRLSAVRLADRILVVSQGRIVEDGTHEQLLKTGGVYAEMYRMQASYYIER